MSGNTGRTPPPYRYDAVVPALTALRLAAPIIVPVRQPLAEQAARFTVGNGSVFNLE